MLWRRYSLIVFSLLMLSVRGRTPNIEPDPLTERMGRMEKSVHNLTKRGPRGAPGTVNADVYVTRQIREVLRHRDNILNTIQQGSASEARYRRKVSGGAVYVRWGRTVCPGDTILLYQGVVGGSYFAHGGGANYLCLSLDPEWANTQDGYQKWSSRMYGTEYQTSTYSKAIFSRVNADWTSLDNHDVPCAVCHAGSRGSQVMIPAILHCPTGWNKEYSGYLMAENAGNRRSEYICVDGAPEPGKSGHENKDGALLYFVEAFCGSLPCPSYREGHELTCVVCTK